MKRVIIVLLLLGLGGCHSQQDLHEFVAQVEARKPGPIDPLPVLEERVPYVYTTQTLRSPFEKNDTSRARRQLSSSQRPKEALESYPLDSLKFSGVLARKGALLALVIDKTGMIHRVKVGNYLGHHEGEVVRIVEHKIEIVEKVVDSQGHWQPRLTALVLTR